MSDLSETKRDSSDLISRADAIDAYGDWYVEEGTAEGFIGTVKQLLEGLPSAQPDLDEWCTDCSEYDHVRHCCPRFNRVIRDAVEEAKGERKTGYWIDTGSGQECSVCGEIQYGYDNGRNFCPNCGAKME